MDLVVPDDAPEKRRPTIGAANCTQHCQRSGSGPMGVGVLRAPAGLTQPTSLPGDRYFSHASVPSTSEQNDGTIKAQAPV